jgi:DNA-binding NtrC family response regulator
VIEAPAALPEAVQVHIARTLSRLVSKPQRSSVLPPGLFVTSHRPLTQLVAEGTIADEFARWMGQSEVKLPTLSDRAEDLRSIVLGMLVGIGLNLRGEPMGIDPRALRLLLEHTWPENELELMWVLLRTAHLTSSRVITQADLAAAGFRPTVAVPVHTPLPAPTRARSRSRRPPRGP